MVSQMGKLQASLLGINLEKATDAITSRSGSVQFVLLFVAVLIMEVAIAEYVFVCPCMRDGVATVPPDLESPAALRVSYVVSFFAWPAVLLFLVVLLSSRRSRRCMSGAYRRQGCCVHFKYLWPSFPPSLMVAGAWVVIALIDGRFYQCAAVRIHIDCVSENASDETEARIRSQNEYHRTMSQFVGWCSIGIMALLSSLVMICNRICSTVPYYQERWMEERRTKEEELFVKVSGELLTNNVKNAWTKFLTERNDESEGWNEISAPPNPNPINKCNKFAYSPLNAWHIERQEEEKGQNQDDDNDESENTADIIAFKVADDEKDMYKMIALNSAEAVPPGVVVCSQNSKQNHKIHVNRQNTHARPGRLENYQHDDSNVTYIKQL